MDALTTALKVAGSGLGAQSERLRVVSENLANAQSTGSTPGSEPYRRKTITFASELDRASGGSFVEINSINRDQTDFPLEFQPGNEAADENGYVKMPNVNVLIEMADMSEANRSYEANLQVVKQARELISMTIDLLRSQGMIGGVGLFDKSPLSGGIGKDFGTLTGGASGAASIGQSFADMLADAAGRTVNTMQQAEQVSVKALQGDADTRAVVDAVMSAEQSLQAAVAIRDKIVTAYLEISRMAI